MNPVDGNDPDRQRIDLSIVIPVYRSQECLRPLLAAIREALGGDIIYEVILVNDDSPDQSWEVIEELSANDSQIIGVDLRRNFGQDNAILTGLRYALGRFIAIMDDDLQHHPSDLPALIEKMAEGHDVVYADFRIKRQRWWKNIGSWFNGKVAEWTIGKPRDVYLSPYKVICRDVAETICEYDGPEPYIDGLLFQVTSRITQIPVEHHDRHSGQSTYTVWRSVRVWARLTFSFSVHPLRLVCWFGFSFAAVGLILTVLLISYRLLFPESFPSYTAGWASLMIAVLTIGGIQMIFLGILGEYSGRTYLKVNKRPQAVVRQVRNRDSGHTGTNLSSKTS